tara:strand:- start:31 stop:867 length:837 start_codon:yes stop_codon:yes gene_type:complete
MSFNPKIFFLTSEIQPFCDTYFLSTFSKQFGKYIHSKEHDIRLIQPKYGFISERKYILREVIRLKDFSINFDNKDRLVNIKSAFIPDTRVQVYFLEYNDYFKDHSKLLYKARNGRFFKDNAVHFGLIPYTSILSLKLFFWVPDILISNDWQMALAPTLLKKIFYHDPYYKKIKSVHIIHSINSEEELLSIDLVEGLEIDKKDLNSGSFKGNLLAIRNSDLNIVINHASDKVMPKIKKNKVLSQALNKSNHLVIDFPSNPDYDDWSNLNSNIYSIIEKI